MASDEAVRRDKWDASLRMRQRLNDWAGWMTYSIATAHGVLNRLVAQTT